MSRQIQIRRGTAAEHENFTGAIGEITMDTTNKTIRVHDGTTAGGVPLAKQSEIPAPYTMPENYDFVIESQLPTAENNYTWYRKYKSGWVEQGGKYLTRNCQITLPVAFVDNNYNVIPNTFKDYIATPRNNMYQAIHEIILGYKGVIIEAQIYMTILINI